MNALGMDEWAALVFGRWYPCWEQVCSAFTDFHMCWQGRHETRLGGTSPRCRNVPSNNTYAMRKYLILSECTLAQYVCPVCLASVDSFWRTSFNTKKAMLRSAVGMRVEGPAHHVTSSNDDHENHTNHNASDSTSRKTCEGNKLRSNHISRCVLDSLNEGVSICPSVGTLIILSFRG